MVQIMNSGMDSDPKNWKRVSVKEEVEDPLEEQLGPLHKRSKLDPSLQV
jgi:hypothetical protein